MNKHVQPISHYPPHEKIKTLKDTKQQSLKSNAGFTRLEAVPKNDVTYSWCMHKLFNISILAVEAFSLSLSSILLQQTLRLT